MEEFYIVIPEKSKCSCCGKVIKNIYKYQNKDYGYYCFMSLIGKPIDKENSKEIPLPSWIFKLMNKYVDENKEDFINDDCFDCVAVNFFNEYMSKEYPYHALWSRAIEVCGKKIPVYQQHMINDYLIMRCKAIKLGK